MYYFNYFAISYIYTGNWQISKTGPYIGAGANTRAAPICAIIGYIGQKQRIIPGDDRRNIKSRKLNPVKINSLKVTKISDNQR